MIGLILNNSIELEYTGLIPGFNHSTMYYNELKLTSEYCYPFMYGFIENNVFSASSITQKLIDSGCTLIIYLGKCNSYVDDKILNVTDLVNPLLTRIHKPRFVRYSNDNVVSGSLQCVTDSQDQIDRPYDQFSAPIVNTCIMNNTQILILVYQITDKSSKSDQEIFKVLGNTLLDKLELILKTDYTVYGKPDKLIKDTAEYMNNSFNPVKSSNIGMDIPSRYINVKRKK